MNRLSSLLVAVAAFVSCGFSTKLTPIDLSPHSGTSMFDTLEAS